jgi:hypothetical protein
LSGGAVGDVVAFDCGFQVDGQTICFTTHTDQFGVRLLAKFGDVFVGPRSGEPARVGCGAMDHFHCRGRQFRGGRVRAIDGVGRERLPTLLIEFVRGGGAHFTPDGSSLLARQPISGPRHCFANGLLGVLNVAHARESVMLAVC